MGNKLYIGATVLAILMALEYLGFNMSEFVHLLIFIAFL